MRNIYVSRYTLSLCIRVLLADHSASRVRKRIRPIYGGPDRRDSRTSLTSENSVRVSRRRRPIREQSAALCEIEPRDAVILRYIPRRASQLREMQHGVTFNCTCMPQHAHLYSSAIAPAGPRASERPAECNRLMRANMPAFRPGFADYRGVCLPYCCYTRPWRITFVNGGGIESSRARFTLKLTIRWTFGVGIYT